MYNLRNIWCGKTECQKNNWRLIALIPCIIANGFVEAYIWATLIGVIPAGVLIYLELTDEKH